MPSSVEAIRKKLDDSNNLLAKGIMGITIEAM